MQQLTDLLENNRAWAAEMERQDPGFFGRLSGQQAPQYLWIANVVVHADLNCLSTIQFAVDVLRVSHIIVCGHYGCGGVLAALRDDKLGLVDNWLRHVQDVRWRYHGELEAIIIADGSRPVAEGAHRG